LSPAAFQGNSSSGTPSGLSASDTQLLFTFGQSLSQDAVGLIFETSFVSIYGLLFLLAVYSILRKGLKSTSSRVLFGVVLYLYATSLTLWSLNVTFWFKRIYIYFISYPDLPLQTREDLGNAVLQFSLDTPMEGLFLFNMVVGDTVVIWRAWVLYTDRLWFLAIPCLMLTMSLVFAIIDITCLAGSGSTVQSSIAAGGALCQHSELISWAFSLVTNVSCTVLIGMKAWEHRRSMRALMTGTSTRTTSERILSLLVESGFIYCLFWLTELILFFDISRDSPAFYLWQLFASMGDQISGLYPTLIVVIVNFQQTIWETSTVGSSGIGAWKVSSRSAVSGSKLGTIRSRSDTTTGHHIHLDEEMHRSSLGLVKVANRQSFGDT